MAEPPAAAAAAAAADFAPQQGQSRFFKLPDFWTASPAAWFGVAEAQFLLRGVNVQRDRFSLVVAVLPESSARRVAHLLANPGDNCYDELRAALVTAHQLTSYQKAEKLLSSEPLGDRRPSELLSEMLELVHPGDERTNLFSLIFLRRLPAAVRVLLTEDDQEDIRALAEKADRCAASLHRSQLHSVAAVSPSEDYEDPEQEGATVGAIGHGREGSQQQRGKGRFKKFHRGNRQPQQRQDNKPAPNTPSFNAQQASGLCYKHFRYGDQAFGCEKPCSWQGN